MLIISWEGTKTASMEWQEDTSKLQQYSILLRLNCVLLSVVLSEGNLTLRPAQDFGTLRIKSYGTEQ